MQKEAQEYVKKWDQCQRFTPNVHQPEWVLNHLSSPWPFAQWGLDIVSPFPKATGKKRYLLVGTDYFTKWIEAEPLAISETLMPKSLSGKTFSPSSGSLVLSSRTIGFSLIVNPSRDIVVIWGLWIGTPPQLTPRGMVRSSLLTKSYWTDSRKG